MLGKGSLLVELLESISHCPDLPCILHSASWLRLNQ